MPIIFSRKKLIFLFRQLLNNRLHLDREHQSEPQDGTVSFHCSPGGRERGRRQDACRGRKRPTRGAGGVYVQERRETKLSTLKMVFSSVQSFSRVWLPPHGLQHARLPCPSPAPGVYPNSWPSSWWCHPTISSSVIPFTHLQSFSASGSFQMSQFFTSGGQSIGVSASISVLPMNIQDWPLGWTGFISLQSKGLSRVFSNTTVQKHLFFGAQPSSQYNFHIHTWLLEKP